MINELWAKRVLNGSVTWADVPAIRKEAVKAVLTQAYKDKKITKKELNALTSEK